ncbi:testis-specific H1 histone [Orycteropus afer afer]|uniref:Testis-specific H1 histone n=1 Tax=Orycteropus afer afer TaxID=1230840 RepID=A0A8B6ZKF6_ORYAF|nr:testis-specific H1 histone [Orycteropus afer afer]
MLRGPPRGVPPSVLKVSHLLLQAISTHRGLTLSALKKELRDAGYEMRRKSGHCLGKKSRPEIKGMFLRVSGSDASGYFRVWKIPRSKRKPGHQRLKESSRSPRRIPRRPGSPPRRRPCRKGAKAKEIRKPSTKVDLRMRKLVSRAKGLLHPRAKEKTRPKVKENGRPRTVKEQLRSRTREDKRLNSKAREEKVKNSEKSVKRTIQKLANIGQNRPDL